MSVNWQKLDLTKASLVKKEVDYVLATLEDSLVNDSFSNNGRSNPMVDAIRQRIEELENFYIQHNDDERAILFEKERLRLRKAIQPFLSSQQSRDGKSVASAADRSQMSKLSKPKPPTTPAPPAQPQELFPLSASRPSTPSGMSRPKGERPKAQPKVEKMQMLPPTPTGRIYAWEANSQTSEPPPKSEITVDGETFIPTDIPGYYNRQNASVPSSNYATMEKYFDFQLVLTSEEMTTLAARKRAYKRPDHKLHRSAAASQSVHATTPYIEPKVITKQLYRPANPDKWVDPQGIRPFKRVV